MHPAESLAPRRREFKSQRAQGKGRQERKPKDKWSSGEEQSKTNASLTARETGAKSRLRPSEPIEVGLCLRDGSSKWPLEPAAEP